jgi:regulator of cell morphogenesis and NO signaling
MSLATTPVKDIAIDRPGATAVFLRHKIDFCCNGGAPLAEAAERRGVDLQVLQEELEALGAEPAAPVQDAAALIHYILERYHETHMQELPEAIRLARRVETVHRDKPGCPEGLASHLALMFHDLLGHQQKEEVVLFPAMLERPGPRLRIPLGLMMAEHEELAEQLEYLADITCNFAPPDSACTTWRALYELCRKLEADLLEHMHLENNVLFPMFA